MKVTFEIEGAIYSLESYNKEQIKKFVNHCLEQVESEDEMTFEQAIAELEHF